MELQDIVKNLQEKNKKLTKEIERLKEEILHNFNIKKLVNGKRNNYLQNH